MNSNNTITISPEQAREQLDCNEADCILLDVRTPAEFASLRATKAMNMPLHTISPESIRALTGKKVICICQKGGRGAQAAAALASFGLTEVCNVAGGTEAWEGAGLPVLRGESSVSLERQVRIAAGTLVVAGIAFGFLVTPYALLLSLFVGCGLIFSGVTNTCGMALILARCPWNSAR